MTLGKQSGGIGTGASAELSFPDKPLRKWSTGEIDRVFRTVSGSPEVAQQRVAWLGNHTIEPTARAATAFAAAMDHRVSNYFGDYDQHFQEVLATGSGMRSFEPDAIVLWLSLRGLAPELFDGTRLESNDVASPLVERVKSAIEEWVAAAKANTAAHVFVANFVCQPISRLGITDVAGQLGQGPLVTHLNSWLFEHLSDDMRVTVVDVNHAIARAGADASWMTRMYRLAKIEWGGPSVNEVGLVMARCLRALAVPSKKCLVVDLDNTMWGGVLGEDGVDGIRISAGDPVGESFRALQAALLTVKDKGVLLAICSKNNQADVEELFASRTDMPLSLDDFSASRINWNLKNENIVAIANELNIGVDSIVFIDDNPAECELVRQTLPDVETLHLAGDPSEFADLVCDLVAFDKISLTAEDRRKTAQYRENRRRANSEAQSTDLNSYLASLGTTVEVRPARAADLNRVHQLFSKTNQFNLTTIRYSKSDVQSMMDDPDIRLCVTTVRDKFGDLGLVGVHLLRLETDRAVIDSMLLSCRALGRGIETAVANVIKQDVFRDSNKTELIAAFVPTKKNAPAASFLAAQGFESTATDADGTEHYAMTAGEGTQLPTIGITLVSEGSGA
ncbi:MAG: HAD-IIIC family phosphatase [Pseudomonadota bacterium]